MGIGAGGERPWRDASRIVLTYGTFDLFHIGHLRLLSRLAALGDYLIVGVSTDEFNEAKGKQSIICYEHRAEIVRAVRMVDLVIPESDWEQKTYDIERFGVSLLGMGEDWQGRFDHLEQFCEVVYLPRTSDVSSSSLKQRLGPLSPKEVSRLHEALDTVVALVQDLT